MEKTSIVMSPQMKYYWANRDKKLSQMKAWAEKNKEARKQYTKKRYEENKESLIAKAKERNMLNKYGMTTTEYEDLFKKQGGVCLICKEFPKTGKLVIDHHHDTGLVRGLLCHHCNLVLGFCRENVDILQNTIRYLGGEDGLA